MSDFRRRLADTLQTTDDCARGQHVLYTFLTEIDQLLARVEKLENDFKAVNTTLESVRAGVESLQPLVTLHAKIKNAAVIVLAAYVLGDQSPIVQKLFTALIGGQ